MRLFVGSLCALALIACGPGNRNSDGGDDDDQGDGDAPMIDAPGPICIDGQHRCDISAYQTCSGGNWVTSETCPTVCDDSLGCVACIPGAATCDQGNVVTCNADGTVGATTMECTGSTVCAEGSCVDACADAATQKSYIGCEYWAADLDNAVEVIDVAGGQNCSLVQGTVNKTLSVCANSGGTAVAGLCDPPSNSCPSGFTCQSKSVCVLDAQHAPFAVVVSNPQSRATDVKVTGAGGMMFTTSVPAGQVVALSPQSPPNTIPDQSLDGTGIQQGGYKIESTLPIVAYQFNPLDNSDVFSNDASLLIPRTAFDANYIGMSWPTTDRRPDAHAYHGYLSIIAWQANTKIKVTPTAGVLASATQQAIAAGTQTMFTLNAFDVLTLEAVANGDLTGTKIEAVDGMQTFGVFGGHEAAGFGETTPPDQTHTAGPCCADHLEDMLFPTSTWGKTFAIARSQQRSNEPDVLKILAQKAGTTITFNPAPVSGSCGTLGVGGSCQVKIAADTTVTASEPVLVGHFLESAIWQDPFFGDAVGSGDPSMAIAVPIEQFRTSYAVLVPSQYQKNYFSIATPSGGSVQVDGLNITLVPFAGSFLAARHQVTAGQHKITCPAGCSVTVYGYSDAVSYMFAGGLDLKQIVID